MVAAANCRPWLDNALLWLIRSYWYSAHHVGAALTGVRHGHGVHGHRSIFFGK